MSKQAPQFVFMTCRAGAEAAVKREVARVEPEWRVSFSRPGFLTFKLAGARPVEDQQLAERNWTFAHAHGISLGRVTGESLSQLVEQVWSTVGTANAVTSTPISDVHVWQREAAVNDEGSSKQFVTPLAIEIEEALRAAAPAECLALNRQRPEPRHPTPRHKLVLDIVIVEPGEWWIGCHRAVTPSERWPGGVIPVTVPEHAVSRAYLKMQEALAWSGLPLAAEDECVEFGCAPGGASQALLDRGLFVTGIDPATVDPAVLEHPRFRHLRKRGKEVQHKEFVGVRWLASDMNIAPDSTLDEVEAIVTDPKLAIRGMVLTLKLADWNLAERLHELAARVRDWGYRDVRVRQLVSGGQEVCLVALRRKALRRLGYKGKHRASGKPNRVSRERHTRRDSGHKSPAGPHF